ncbi:Fur family transcriptional regulator [Planktotalea sp.]|uniref:Fur family transcriptional regulator n=1 Tax=Planktotalea sp. TaxID=2029877 RepID=UPI0025FAAAB6|nr:Fur family transcriptional regulator [Planktotalea sp.]
MDPIGFSSHDHAGCIAGNLARIEARCKQAKLQLTPVRRRVLEILLQDHRALGAYDILDRLRDEGLGSQPPVAYRALDFLVKHGFAHKIERMNAFVACAHPGEDHAPAFLICRKCDMVVEAQTEPARGQLGSSAKLAGFLIERAVVEAEGVCLNCAEGPQS